MPKFSRPELEATLRNGTVCRKLRTLRRIAGLQPSGKPTEGFLAVYSGFPLNAINPLFEQDKPLNTLLREKYERLRNVGLLVCSRIIETNKARSMSNPDRQDVQRHLTLLENNPGLISGLLVSDKSDVILTLFTTKEPETPDGLKITKRQLSQLPEIINPNTQQVLGLTTVKLFCDTTLLALPPAGGAAYSELSRLYALPRPV